jgi:hypothetical protein
MDYGLGPRGGLIPNIRQFLCFFFTTLCFFRIRRETMNSRLPMGPTFLELGFTGASLLGLSRGTDR